MRVAIKICQDENVLRDYLETRQKEVVSIMMTLFSQEYAVDAYANERYEDGLKDGRRAGLEDGIAVGVIKGAVEMCQDIGQSFSDTVAKVAAKFAMSHDEADKSVSQFWHK